VTGPGPSVELSKLLESALLWQDKLGAPAQGRACGKGGWGLNFCVRMGLQAWLSPAFPCLVLLAWTWNKPVRTPVSKLLFRSHIVVPRHFGELRTYSESRKKQ
jgi:hypothetical protein